MIKIDEKRDLSKEVLDIDIESPVFYAMLKDLNKEIQRCIRKVYDEEFESGEISLKLSIEIPDAFEIIPKENEFGEMINETFKYRQPYFEHKVTTSLKKQFKQEGFYGEKRDIQYKDGKFVAIPIKDAQIHIDDMK